MTASLPLPQDDAHDVPAAPDRPPLPSTSAADAAAAPPPAESARAKAPAKKPAPRGAAPKKPPRAGAKKASAKAPAQREPVATTSTDRMPVPAAPEQPATQAEIAAAHGLPPTVIVAPRPDVPVWERTPPRSAAPTAASTPAPVEAIPVEAEADVVAAPSAAPVPAALAMPSAEAAVQPAEARSPVPAPARAPAVEAPPAERTPGASTPAIVRRPAPLPRAVAADGTPAIRLHGLTKSFGETRAVDAIDLTIPAGTFYGLVGPNGAGKTTTLSMMTGLLRADRGSVEIAGIDLAAEPARAKRLLGVLPDRLRTFDRLTGRQLLYYYGVLRGLKPAVAESRTADLARAFDLTGALGRPVADYSAGMTKKVMLAGAMIHSPRVLVLDEPFEAVDPISSAVILDILADYVTHGGTVVLSSHGMELVERVCTGVAVIVAGQVLAEGTVDQVRGDLTLEQRLIELAGGLSDVEGLEWLHTFSG